MYDLNTARSANAREVAAILALAEAADDAALARTVLPGWTALDLLDHVARALTQQAEAFERGRAGVLDAPEFPTSAPTTRAAALAALRAGGAAMQAALGALGPADLDRPTPLPFAVLPTAAALQIAVIEYGMLRWDLERALRAAAYDLPADVSGATFAMLPGLLPAFAGGGAPPSAPVTIALSCEHGALGLAFDGAGWQVGPPAAEPTCTITASGSDLTMFAIGRLGVGDGSVRVTGDRSLADAFKRHFPGP
jgi:uncharacterized protein (TIGR03083 family)